MLGGTAAFLYAGFIAQLGALEMGEHERGHTFFFRRKNCELRSFHFGESSQKKSANKKTANKKCEHVKRPPKAGFAGR